MHQERRAMLEVAGLLTGLAYGHQERRAMFEVA